MVHCHNNLSAVRDLRLISYSKNYSLKVEKEILGLRTCWVDNCLHILH